MRDRPADRARAGEGRGFRQAERRGGAKRETLERAKPVFGHADLETGTPAPPNTPYMLASLTKPFAATIVMQLVEQIGKIESPGARRAALDGDELDGLVVEVPEKQF